MRNRRDTGDGPLWQDEPEIRLGEAEHGWTMGPDAGVSATAVGGASHHPTPNGAPTPGGVPPRLRLRRPVTAVLAAVVLVAVVAIANRNSGPQRQPVPTPIATPSARAVPPRGTAAAITLEWPVTPVTGVPPSFGAGTPSRVIVYDVAVSQGWIYGLRSDPTFRLFRTKPDSSQQVSTEVNTGATRLAVDSDVLWLAADVDSSQPTSTRIQRYQARTLTPEGPEIAVPGSVSELIAADDVGWVATTAGLFSIRDGRHAEIVHTVDKAVGAIALDLANHRLIAALPQPTGTELLAVDPRTGAVTMTGHLPLVDVSLAATSASVWFAGFGDPGGYGGIGVLLPGSLDAGRDRSDELSVGPGARIWAGDAVIWVNSTGSGLTSCVDSQTGKVLATWSELIGPISSALGIRVSVGENAALLLSLTGGCTG